MTVGRPVERRFADTTALARWLAGTVVRDLRQAMGRRGQASLALSGGRTPRLYLPMLARRPLPWRRVSLTLTDERWVAVSHPDSNERLIRHGVHGHPAARARVIGLKTAQPTVQRAAPLVERRLRRLPWPLDVVVLGMGEDGHIASLFPGSAALDARRGRGVAEPYAPAAHARVSLSLPALGAVRRTYLVLTGDAKRTLWEQVRAGGAVSLPVAQWLRRARGAVHVLTAP